MKQRVVYVHGKGGSAEEADRYKMLFPESDVIGFDYKAKNPWDAKKEFPSFFKECRRGYDSVVVVAASMGAFLTLSSLDERLVDKACFVSPVVNMEGLIDDLMLRANVTEKELSEKLEIDTEFGETLSWKYLCYVRNNPIRWNVPTCILYGEKDELTSIKTISDFAGKTGAELTVMKDGEHWFHTEAQMQFLDDWIKKVLPLKTQRLCWRMDGA